jgi:hypothetical protein
MSQKDRSKQSTDRTMDSEIPLSATQRANLRIHAAIIHAGNAVTRAEVDQHADELAKEGLFDDA